MFCDFVGTTLLANVVVAFGKLEGRVTPVVEAETSAELASVVAVSTSVRDDCVTEAETTGTVTSSALESTLSVPMETCCAVDASRIVVTLFAAAVAAAIARTKNLAECIAVGFFSESRSRTLATDVQDCGEFYL